MSSRKTKTTSAIIRELPHLSSGTTSSAAMISVADARKNKNTTLHVEPQLPDGGATPTKHKSGRRPRNQSLPVSEQETNWSEILEEPLTPRPRDREQRLPRSKRPSQLSSCSFLIASEDPYAGQPSVPVTSRSSYSQPRASVFVDFGVATNTGASSSNTSGPGSGSGSRSVLRKEERRIPVSSASVKRWSAKPATVHPSKSMLLVSVKQEVNKLSLEARESHASLARSQSSRQLPTHTQVVVSRPSTNAEDNAEVTSANQRDRRFSTCSISSDGSLSSDISDTGAVLDDDGDDFIVSDIPEKSVRPARSQSSMCSASASISTGLASGSSVYASIETGSIRSQVRSLASSKRPRPMPVSPDMAMVWEEHADILGIDSSTSQSMSSRSRSETFYSVDMNNVEETEQMEAGYGGYGDYEAEMTMAIYHHRQSVARRSASNRVHHASEDVNHSSGESSRSRPQSEYSVNSISAGSSSSSVAFGPAPTPGQELYTYADSDGGSAYHIPRFEPERLSKLRVMKREMKITFQEYRDQLADLLPFLKIQRTYNPYDPMTYIREERARQGWTDDAEAEAEVDGDLDLTEDTTLEREPRREPGLEYEFHSMVHAKWHKNGKMTRGTIRELLCYLFIEQGWKQAWADGLGDQMGPDEEWYLRPFFWAVVRHAVPATELFAHIKRIWQERDDIEHWMADHMVQDLCHYWLIRWQGPSDDDIKGDVRRWINEVVQPRNPKSAEYLMASFEYHNPKGLVIAGAHGDVLSDPDPEIPILKSALKIKDENGEYHDKYLVEFMKPKAQEELARQLALIFQESYCSLPWPAVMVLDWYSSGDKRKTAAPEQPLLDVFNSLYQWVARTLIDAPSDEHIAKLVSFWMEIGKWCFDQLNFSAAAAIYMGISCDRSAERWKSPEMIEKICYSHEFKLAKMGKVREIQPYYESHLLQAELFDPGFDVPGGRKKKSYYGLIMKDKYNEHRPFVPHLGMYRGLMTKHKGGGAMIDGYTPEGEPIICVDVMRELGQLSYQLEHGRRPYPYIKHPQVQEFVKARMQANLNYSVPLSLHAPGQRDKYATSLPPAPSLPHDVWAPALKKTKPRAPVAVAPQAA